MTFLDPMQVRAWSICLSVSGLYYLAECFPGSQIAELFSSNGYVYVYMHVCHIFFIHSSSTDEVLSCFHILAVLKNAEKEHKK